MYKITNVSRQAIPVQVVKNNTIITLHMAYNGPESFGESETITPNMRNLVSRKLILVDEIVKKVNPSEPIIEAIIEPEGDFVFNPSSAVSVSNDTVKAVGSGRKSTRRTNK